MPEALISITTSPGPGAGSGKSRISTRRSPASTTPFMRPAPSISSTRQCTPREGKRPSACEGLQRRLAHLGELLVADPQLVQAALLCRDHGAVDLAAIEEDRGEDVEEDERQHRRREAAIHRGGGAGVVFEIAPKENAAEDPQDERHHDPGQDPPPWAAAGRDELMGDDQPGDDEHARDAEAREIDDPAERLELRQPVEHAAPDQRPEHDQDREAEHHEGAADHEADRFEPREPPRPGLADAVGAVEADPQALDSARGEIEREGGADRQDIAAL